MAAVQVQVAAVNYKHGDLRPVFAAVEHLGGLKPAGIEVFHGDLPQDLYHRKGGPRL